MTNRKVGILIEGWRPWGQDRHLLTFSISQTDKPHIAYLKQLRLSLDTLYYQEELKVLDSLPEEERKEYISITYMEPEETSLVLMEDINESNL